MARTHTLGSLFAHLLAPVTDAIYAETGKRLTMPGWGRITRTLVAMGLRAAADLIQPAPAQPEAPAPEPVPAQTAPVASSAVEPKPVPFGWGSVDLPAPTIEPAKVKPARNRAKNSKLHPVPMPSANRTTKAKPGKAPAKPTKARPEPKTGKTTARGAKTAGKQAKRTAVAAK